MFVIKGQHLHHKKFIDTLLSSVDMTEESFLYLLQYLTTLEFLEIDSSEFNTVNAITGESIELLTKKHNLINWFSSIKFPASLPALVFDKFNETDVEEFFKRGTKLKFLKPEYMDYIHVIGIMGEGIHVVDSMETVKQIVKEQQQKDKHYQPGQTLRNYVLQDTLEDVATFEGYKFHLRVWLVVVVRDKKISVYISNYHTYEFSKELYNVKRLKERSVFNSHKHQNTKNAFFPMERPDRWTIADTSKAMKRITKYLKIVFKEQHEFKPNYKFKNGFTILGADVLLDNQQNPYILEINAQPNLYKTFDSMFPEYLHLGMGGAPLQLFSTLYGTPEKRTTPFSKPLQTFYDAKYTNSESIKDAVKEIFTVSIELESAESYLLYQTMNCRKRKTTTRKAKRSPILSLE